MSLTVTGLKTKTEYRFTTAGNNEAGQGEFSEESDPIILGGLDPEVLKLLNIIFTVLLLFYMVPMVTALLLDSQKMVC